MSIINRNKIENYLNLVVNTINRFGRIKYAQVIWWIFFASALTGIIFALLQTAGIPVGGTMVTASNSKLRLIIMASNYLMVHLVLILAIANRTFLKKISRYWIFLVLYLVLNTCLVFLVQKSPTEIFFIYIRLIGLMSFIFLHSIKISNKYLFKLANLSLIIFKVVIIFSIIQLIAMLFGMRVTIHSGRIDSIFSDYNDLSSYLLSLIPILWVLERKKSMVIGIALILISRSTTAAMVLILFIIFWSFQKLKKKKSFLKTALVITTISTTTIVLFMQISLANIRHPDNPILKLRQLVHVINIETIIIIKNNLGNFDFGKTINIIGIEHSTGVRRLIQFIDATLGWNSVTELSIGLRRGLVEGLYLNILIKFGFIGFLLFTFYYWKYYIKKTDSKVWRLYFVALYIGAGFALPIFSFSISMFIVSIQLYVFQRLLVLKNNNLIEMSKNRISLKNMSEKNE